MKLQFTIINLTNINNTKTYCNTNITMNANTNNSDNKHHNNNNSSNEKPDNHKNNHNIIITFIMSDREVQYLVEYFFALPASLPGTQLVAVDGVGGGPDVVENRGHLKCLSPDEHLSSNND